MNWLNAVAVAGVALVAGACASTSGMQAGALLPDNSLSVYVENGTTVNLRLFALESGAEVSLGRISALEQRKVRIPGPAAGVIQLVARPSADLGLDRRHTSDPITVIPGQQITWRLHDSPGVVGPQLSTVWITACSDPAGC